MESACAKSCTFIDEEVEDELRDACGVFGCILCDDNETTNVADKICSGLNSLQHRGQESAGIVTSDGQDEHFRIVRDHGLVNHIFNNDVLLKLGSGSRLGVGHTRYSTAGLKESINCIQPFVVYTSQGIIAVAHNGELVNAKSKRNELLKRGVGLSTDVDSELISQMLSWAAAHHSGDGRSWIDWIELMMNELNTTSYSLVIMVRDRLFAVRDPWGNRPLCIGELEDKGFKLGWVVASESTAFSSINAKFLKEVEPGEIIELASFGVSKTRHVPRSGGSLAFCIFEYVYFASKDSKFEGQQVYGVRFKCGRQLGLEAFVKADIVSTVPDSATPAALGYSSITGTPYTEVLCKNNYIGRTFIQPSTKLRQQSITKKFSPIVESFKGLIVVLVDDSIVRGNTMKQIVKLLKETGAKEVHIRVASPPVKFPCYMGINIPTKEELIANKLNPEQVCAYLGADSVVYLSVEGLLNAVQSGIKTDEKGHCTACLTGNYPVALEW